MSLSRSPDDGLKVGYVLKKYPRLSETFVLNEMLGLEEAGTQVSVFSLRLPDDGRFHSQVSLLRGDVHYLPGFSGTSVLDAFRALSIHQRVGDGGVERALRFLERISSERRALLLVQGLCLAENARRQGIEHLHAHFMTVAAHTAYLAHLFTGVPFSVTAHAKDIYRAGVDPGAFREVAEAATAVITVCEANRRYIYSHLLGGGSASVARIYNGIPLKGRPRTTGAPREDNLVLAAGRLVEKKGFHVLLEACRLLVARGIPVRCVIVGDGEQRDELLRQRIDMRLEPHVHFTGALCRDDVDSWMARAQLLAAPCLTGEDGNRDALPTVLLEAMAANLPVVSTRVGGIPEIVSDGQDGVLVEENDAGALADALQRVLADPSLRRRLATAGRAKVLQRFDRRRTIPQLIGVFQTARRSRDVVGVGA